MSRASTETEEYRTRIDLLYEIMREANSVPEVSRLLERILGVTQQTLNATASSLLLVDDDNGELCFHTVLGSASDRLRQVRLGRDSGIVGWVARNATCVLANDVSTDSRFDKKTDNISGFETKSIIAVPLTRGEKVIGVIEVLNKSGGGFNERDLRVLKGFASTEALVLLVLMAITARNNINSLALDQAVLDGYRSTATAWASAVDTKDSYAHAHSQRVREYAMLAANCLSLPPTELQAIEFGALLHDVGKIGIESSLLSKPGPLTDREWEVMRRHSRAGADILGAIPFLDKAGEIVLYHHEKYDGTGYPEGLKGKEIPIGARLVAVADAFDTMTTDRSYRPALSVDKAIVELIEGIGKQFCPVAVEAFVSAFRKREPQPVADDKVPEAIPEEENTPYPHEAPEEPASEIPEIPTEPDTKNTSTDIFKGDIRLVVPITAGIREVRRFKELLAKVEGLKIVLSGGSEEEGHIIMLTLQKPMALMNILDEMPVVEDVSKQGKNIVVDLFQPGNRDIS